MMTFEKVLEVFKDYLTEDTNCEVILTKHGYTVMQWDENSKSWYVSASKHDVVISN